ncbi:MAG TPA: DUF1499 domain-containing protein [Pseudomonadales bacterium]
MKELFFSNSAGLLKKNSPLGFIVFACFLMLFCVSSFAGKEEFFQCPASPNCVSTEVSASDLKHYVKPFQTIDGSEETWVKIKKTVLSMPRTKIIKEDKYYLKAKVKSAVFRFVDDLDILFSPETKTLSIKSASNVGYSDLGVNRKRVAELRRLLTEQDVLLAE